MEQEQEIISENQTEPTQDRRSFLRSGVVIALGAAATSMAGTQEKEERPEENETTSFADICLLESYREKIEYREESLELSPQAQEAILAIAEYQDELFKIVGGESVSLNQEQKVAPKSTERQGEELNSAKEKLYQRLSRVLPNLPPYSPKNLTRFLAYDMPRYLAPYGIFAKPVLILRMVPELNCIETCEVALGFFKIAKTEKQKVARWGQEIERDIVFLERPLRINGVRVNPISMADVPAQAFFGNVIIYEDLMSEEDKPVDIGEEAAIMRDTPILPFLRQAAKSNEEMQLEFALLYSALKLGEKREKNIPQSKSKTQSSIEHETGHLLESRGQKPEQVWPIPETTNVQEYLKSKTNNMTHQEISAFLMELQYADDKARVLANVLPLSMEAVDQDFSHDMAITWLLDKIIDFVERDPAAFDIEIFPEAKVNRRIQIIAQLDKLTDNQKALEKMITEIKTYHQSHLDEDFSSQYFQYLEGKAGTAISQKPKPIISKKVDMITGAGLALAVSTIFISRVIARRMKEEDK